MLFRVLLMALLGAASALPETDVAHLLELKLFQTIHALDAATPGVLGVATIDLTSGRVFVYNGDAVFPTASSIKIAILVQLFRAEEAGTIKFTDPVTLRPEDNVGGSSGPLEEELKQGVATRTILSLAEDMIVYSDNTATNKCIEAVGMQSVNKLLESFGLRATHLRRKMMDTKAAARGDENVSTPLELARLVELIYRGKAASPASCTRMIAILKRVKASLRSVVPAEIAVASKPGDIDGVKCEVGIVYVPKRPFVVNVMSTYLEDKANPVGSIAATVFEYFQKLGRSNQYGRRLDP